ncbi:hypothetical protein [Desulfosporosinus fructosivorans]
MRHSARSYDAEQTNRSSSCLWGAGYPAIRHPWLSCRLRTSCAQPRIWGRELERKFAVLLT